MSTREEEHRPFDVVVQEVVSAWCEVPSFNKAYLLDVEFNNMLYTMAKIAATVAAPGYRPMPPRNFMDRILNPDTLMDNVAFNDFVLKLRNELTGAAEQTIKEPNEPS